MQNYNVHMYVYIYACFTTHSCLDLKKGPTPTVTLDDPTLLDEEITAVDDMVVFG
jgi:hypothetical protein